MMYFYLVKLCLVKYEFYFYSTDFSHRDQFRLIKKGERKSGFVPYHKYQHFWFFFIMPPLLLPVYFNIENFYHVIKEKKYKV